MKLKLVNILLVCLMTSSVFASFFWMGQGATANWNDANNWDKDQTLPINIPGVPPTSTGEEIKVLTEAFMTSGANALINSNVGTYSTKISINGSASMPAILTITGSNAFIGCSGQFRVGSASSGGTGATGKVIQSGGTVTAPTTYIGYYGTNVPDIATGYYTISGGTLTCSSGLWVGSGVNGGNTIGTFTVDCSTGSFPTITVSALNVGGQKSAVSTGTLIFNIGANGLVSPITITGSTKNALNLDAGGTSSTTRLVVSLSPGSTVPPGDILLVNNTSTGSPNAVIGSFDTINGAAATEGALVDIGGGHFYTLTYMYDSVSKTVGSARSNTYNDIALIPSMTISTPATNTGDLLIAAVATDGDTSTTIAAPSGWTLINSGANGSAVTLAAWWKLAVASEPANYTFSWSGANRQQAYGWMMRFSGQDANNPIDACSTANDSSITPTSPAVTTKVNNCLILRTGAFDDNSITVDNPTLLSGHTTITADKSSSTASSGVVSGGAGYVKQSTAGSSNTSTFSLTTAKSARTLTIAIAPASTGPGVCCEDDIKP